VVRNWYEFADYRFSVRSTSEAFGDWLNVALAGYRVEPSEEDRDAYPSYSLVVEDGTRGRDRVGKRFNILYMGTWDIVRTLDPCFLGRALLRQIDAIGQGRRADAVFLEAGLVDVGGVAALVSTRMVPALCAARRRAEKAWIYAPGGTVAAIDPESGDLVAPSVDMHVPADAIERLVDAIPGGDHHDRFVVEDGERRPLGAVVMPPALDDGDVGRAQMLMQLARSTMNLGVLGGRAIEGLASSLDGAECYSARWRSTQELLDSLARSSGAIDPMRRTVGDLRPSILEGRSSRP
jgi:hypothetical protein